jgi:hypothetical protein
MWHFVVVASFVIEFIASWKGGFTLHHLPALIYGLFCGNAKYFPPQKNPTGAS